MHPEQAKQSENEPELAKLEDSSQKKPEESSTVPGIPPALTLQGMIERKIQRQRWELED